MVLDSGEIRQGLKRSLDEEDPIDNLPAPKRIKALDQDVVNKIAAGEIIVAPMHALKELIENAVDAGSTSLEIAVKEGGSKLLQITDNGHGIHRDDLAILCERFTTSKLKAFEDLSSIATYGFRGEALASISHIAHLTITTRTAESSCAWRAHYADGVLVPAKPGQSADPKPIAGRGGTQITVEDLFYNVPTRQRALRSSSEEYGKILDVVGRYAVHCRGVSFSCKKFGEAAFSISTQSKASTIDTIRIIYGSNVANELFAFETGNSQLAFVSKGYASNSNYHVKKTTILLFINNRLVESSTFKKAIDHLYAAYLPKGGHPFVYIGLEIEPQCVDVNIHPTKREVNFLNEEEIVEAVCSNIREHLSQVDSSRSYVVQSLLPGLKEQPGTVLATATAGTSRNANANQKVYENALVRTDSNMRKITSMLEVIPDKESNQSLDQQEQETGIPQYEQSLRPRTDCRLTSIKHLRASVRSEIHAGLTEMFMSHSYVGIVDAARQIVAMQSGVKLFLVEYGTVSAEFFYQVGLAEFGNFGRIEFTEPLSVVELIKVAVEQEAREHADEADTKDVQWSSIPEIISQQLSERRDMLKDYFNLELDESGNLISIPLLLKGYSPPLAKLPHFLLRLGPCVDWDDEERCFATFIAELARFYTPLQLPAEPDESETSHQQPQADASNDGNDGLRIDPTDQPWRDSQGMGNPEQSTIRDANAIVDANLTLMRKELERSLEHVLFPALKTRLVATKQLLDAVVEVADLKGLYKVFERC